MLNQDFWQKYFKVYDILNLIIPYQELLSEIIKKAEIKKNDLVLDAGIGTGNLALLLERKGREVIGLDFSQDALDICKKKNSGGYGIACKGLGKLSPFLFTKLCQ